MVKEFLIASTTLFVLGTFSALGAVEFGIKIPENAKVCALVHSWGPTNEAVISCDGGDKIRFRPTRAGEGNIVSGEVDYFSALVGEMASLGFELILKEDKSTSGVYDILVFARK